MKNIVIITSIINCTRNPLSYINTRSVFSTEERYEQTLKTIESLKNNINNLDILFCECSDLSKNMEENIKNKVTFYINCYNDEEIKETVNGLYKGLGESKLLLNVIKNFDFSNYKNIFKISGRYYLNDNFDFQIFDTNENVFTNWDGSKIAYCTIFYKVNNIEYLRKALLESEEGLRNGLSLELCMYKNFKHENIKILDKINVSGYLSTEGYHFTV